MRRSRSKRWPATKEIASPGVHDTLLTAPPDAVSLLVHRAPARDDATANAIEERTWPRPEHDVPRRPRHASAPLAGGARYELGALIGRGGMGEVFAAYDAQIGREVAIKRLHPDKVTPSSLARFLREARIQGWLDHPSIPSVYELGTDEAGCPFFVMKRLSGITLFEILAQRATRPGPSMTEQQLLRAFVEICLAIEFAHTRGVLHRDLKPANILLGDFGEVYVLDWGLARVLDESVATSDEARHTLEVAACTVDALGTPGYMSPEQVRGDELDGRADVYALGCVLFEILTGRRLHPDGHAGMTCALAGITTSPSTVRPDVAPELDELCRRATATDRNERIASARALGEAVQRYLDGDRDLALRRTLAQAHLEAARGAVVTGAWLATPGSDVPAAAMREAGRALALDPALPGAAELVSRLMLEPATSTPATVVAELEESRRAEQASKAKLAIGSNIGYACLAPVLLAFGIHDAPYLCALVAIAAVNIAIASVTLVRGRAAPRLLAAAGYAAMCALIARMFTPLIFAPGMAAVTLMAYAQHPATRRRELASASLLAVAAVLGVWGAELCGLLGATTVIQDGSVTLMPPLDGLSELPIYVALCGYPILLVGVAAEVAYSAARRGREARRELHVRAWRLRQLVPLDESPAASARSLGAWPPVHAATR